MLCHSVISLWYLFLASCAGSSGWYLFNGSCYYISPKYGADSRKTWYDARKYCMQHGGDLASVHSQQENGFIITLVRKLSVKQT